MILVSFYCDIDGGTFYKNSSLNLINQCKLINMEYHIVEESFGNTWIDNVKAKPKFLIKMMEVINDDFIWLDIDCSIHKKIDFKIESDWMVDFKKSCVPQDYVHIIKKNDKTKYFLEEWVNEINLTNRGSHSSFINIHKKINVKKIPKGYVSLGVSNIESKKKYLNGKKI